MVQEEGIIKGRDDAGKYYKGEGWCMRTLQMGGMMQEDDIKV